MQKQLVGLLRLRATSFVVKTLLCWAALVVTTPSWALYSFLEQRGNYMVYSVTSASGASGVNELIPPPDNGYWDSRGGGWTHMSFDYQCYSMDCANFPMADVYFGSVDYSFPEDAISHTLHLPAPTGGNIAVTLVPDCINNHYDFAAEVFYQLPTLPTSPPSVPEFESVPSRSNDGHYTVRWEAVSGVDIRYRLQERQDGGSWITVYEGANLSQSFSSLPGSSYEYRIQSYYDYNPSLVSAWEEADDPVEVAGAVPIGLTGPLLSDGDYSLSWQAPNPVGMLTHYELQQVGPAGTSTFNVGLSTTHAFSNQPSGRYRYRARICYGVSCGNYSTEHDVIVNQGGGDTLPPAPVNQPNLADSNFHGTLPGEFSVSKSGAAVYQIPIQLPPTTGGLKPNLLLNYNSQHGNGLIGHGWSLRGLSRITRCPATIAQDNSIDPVDFDNNDRYCLDGQRLIKIAPNEYRTEIDTFSRIRAYGQQGQGPAYFTVETKGGLYKEYGIVGYGSGGHGDARIEAQGRADQSVIVWALAKVSDRSSNYYEVHYNENTGDGAYRPSSLKLSGNSMAGTLPDTTIHFGYAGRADTMVEYQGGAKQTTDQRLTHIDTGVFEYRISYAPHSHALDQSRVSAIQRCDTHDVCQAATTFEAAPVATQVSFSAPQALAPGYPSTPSMNNEISQYYYGDWNGDGITDAMLRPLYGDEDDPDDPGTNYWLLNDDQLNTTLTTDPVDPAHFKSKTQVYFGDWNGDGLTDMMTCHTSGNRWYINQTPANGPVTFATPVHIARSAGALPCYRPAPEAYGPTVPSAEYNTSLHVGDWNGDGLTDVMSNQWYYDVAASGPRPSVGYHNRWWINQGNLTFTEVNDPLPVNYYDGIRRAHNSGLSFADWNGDGITDVLVCCERGAFGATTPYSRLYINDGALNFTAHNPIAAADLQAGMAFSSDFNRDGLTDLLITGSNNLWYLNTGDMRFTLRRENPITVASNDHVELNMFGYYMVVPNNEKLRASFDLNGDQLPDLFGQHYIALGNDSINFYLHGPGFNFMLGHTVDYAANDKTQVQDINGDGLADWMHGETKLWHINQQASRPYLITAITDGLGNTTEIDYAGMADKSVYNHGDCAPTWAGNKVIERCELNPQKRLVKAVRRENGNGGQRHSSYRYEGYKYNLQGRGSLGFARMIRTDHDIDTHLTDRITDHYYRQQFPYSGLASRIETRLSGHHDGVLWRIDNQYVMHGQSYVFPALSQKIQQNCALDQLCSQSEHLSGVMTTQTTSNQSDDYGNLEVVTLDTVDATGQYQSRTTSTYTPNVANWQLDQLTRREVRRTGADSAIATRSTAYAYDNQGRLIQAITEPDNAPHITLTTNYELDVHGNIISETVSGADISSRSVHTEYDAQGRFATRLTNANDESTQQQYDTRFGGLTNITDPNAQQLCRDYDRFGRLIEQRALCGTANEIITQVRYYQCDNSCPINAAYKIVNQSSGHAPQTTYHDRFGREVRQQRVSLDGRISYVSTRYNQFGHVDRVSRPYFVGEQTYYTYYRYDALGRQVLEESPVSGGLTTGYLGLQVTVTNGNHQTRTRLINSLGQTVWIDDADNQRTSFTYDPFGNVQTVTDPANNQTINDYDIRGRKVEMNDPDSGEWQYTYNSLGELIEQRDAKNQLSQLDYDALGRLIERREAVGSSQLITSNWVYGNNPSQNTIGRLVNESDSQGFNKQYHYDTHGRLESYTVTIDSNDYTISQNYDGAGRIFELNYPQVEGNRLTVQHRYSPNGHLKALQSSDGSTVYWRALATTAEGQLTHSSLGANVAQFAYYDAQTGRLTRLQSFNSQHYLQDLRYAHDTIGNLDSREDVLQGLTEQFDYDNLNRVTSAAVSGSNGYSPQSYHYDTLGNITDKTGVGSYSYNHCNAGPHAVCQAGGITYQYDANGNRISSSNGHTMSWTAFNKPRHISSGGTNSTFYYAPDRARYKQVQTNGGSADTTLYIGGLYEKVTMATTTTHKHYLQVNGQSVAVHQRVNDGSQTTAQTLYLHHDHLGSITLISDSNGHLVERLSYDTFGQRRNADWTVPGAPVSSSHTRGYTGHEHLDEHQLIHMNGRVYDPVIARFTSADPLIPEPSDSQSWNRYSYVRNNPLGYTDPSGFCESTQQDDEDRESDCGGPQLQDIPTHPSERATVENGNVTITATRESQLRARLARLAGVERHDSRLVAGMDRDFDRAANDGIFDNDEHTGHQVVGGDQAGSAVAGTADGGAIPATGEGGFGWLGKLFGWLGTRANAIVLAMSPSKLDSNDMGLATGITANFVPRDGQIIFRVWGGLSPEFNPSWTPLDPRLAPDAYRTLDGLPDGNAGTFLTVGKIRNASNITVTPGVELDGNIGGWPEYVVPNAAGQIQRLQRITADPPF